MALLRCNKCGHLAEQADQLTGQTQDCPQCGSASKVYPTLYFVQQLLARYVAAQRELRTLKAAAAESTSTASARSSTAISEDFDLSSTDALATVQQLLPIRQWFQSKQIRAEADPDNVDTTGFFDDAAELIGNNLPVLKDVLERIRWSQKKGYASALIKLADKPPAEADTVLKACRQLYDFSLLAKCLHNREEKTLRLVLQTAPMTRYFFDGEWLEWYALMMCLRHAHEQRWSYSAARSLKLTLADNDVYELDVFMLRTDDKALPLLIECKTGEFRQDIDRYLALKKRLGLSRDQFVMCIAGLAEDTAKAYSAMYDLSFVNEQTLGTHLARL